MKEVYFLKLGAQQMAFSDNVKLHCHLSIPLIVIQNIEKKGRTGLKNTQTFQIIYVKVLTKYTSVCSVVPDENYFLVEWTKGQGELNIAPF